MEPITVPLKEAARLIGCSKSKVYQLIADGELDNVRLGKRNLVRVASIKRLVGADEPQRQSA